MKWAVRPKHMLGTCLSSNDQSSCCGMLFICSSPNVIKVKAEIFLYKPELSLSSWHDMSFWNDMLSHPGALLAWHKWCYIERPHVPYEAEISSCHLWHIVDRCRDWRMAYPWEKPDLRWLLSDLNSVDHWNDSMHCSESHCGLFIL